MLAYPLVSFSPDDIEKMKRTLCNSLTQMKLEDERVKFNCISNENFSNLQSSLQIRKYFEDLLASIEREIKGKALIEDEFILNYKFQNRGDSEDFLLPRFKNFIDLIRRLINSVNSQDLKSFLRQYRDHFQIIKTTFHNYLDCNDKFLMVHDVLTYIKPNTIEPISKQIEIVLESQSVIDFQNSITKLHSLAVEEQDNELSQITQDFALIEEPLEVEFSEENEVLVSSSPTVPKEDDKVLERKATNSYPLFQSHVDQNITHLPYETLLQRYKDFLSSKK